MPKTQRDVPEVPSITIERRETVAVIMEGEGGRPMLQAAFLAAGDYLAENITTDTANLSLEFRYGGHLFKATAEEIR